MLLMFLERLANYLEKLSRFSSALCLAFVMSILVIQVFLRFFFKSNLLWAEEAARYLMIWIVMIISSVLIKEDALIKVDFFDNLWSEKFIKYREIFYKILMLFLFAVLLREGWIQAIYSKSWTISSMDLSWFWPYLAIPVGVALMIFQYFFLIVKDILKYFANS